MRRPIPDRRMAHVHGRVSAVKSESWAADYLRVSRKLPLLIHRNGMGEALSFLQVRIEDKEVASLLQSFEQWLVDERHLLARPLLASWVQTNFTSAVRAEREAIEWALVHKRVTEALLTEVEAT